MDMREKATPHHQYISIIHLRLLITVKEAGYKTSSNMFLSTHIRHTTHHIEEALQFVIHIEL